ncbi:hypothetical protein [Chamaesiphon sp. VAR_69_metabat_338]|nr:hypothetical protein [Chamaesiphon sp. VAR_69_metabat_338]
MPNLLAENTIGSIEDIQPDFDRVRSIYAAILGMSLLTLTDFALGDRSGC